MKSCPPQNLGLGTCVNVIKKPACPTRKSVIRRRTEIIGQADSKSTDSFSSGFRRIGR